MKVLYLEDDEKIRKAMEIVLTKKGHDIKCVESLGDFKDTLQVYGPDIVITDLMLPDVQRHNYLETLKEVVSCIGKGKIPVVVYSGAPMDVDKCLDLGATECLVKGDVTPLQVPMCFDSVIDRFKLLNALDTRSVPMPSENPFDRVPITAGGVGEEMDSLAIELRNLADG